MFTGCSKDFNFLDKKEKVNEYQFKSLRNFSINNLDKATESDNLSKSIYILTEILSQQSANKAVVSQILNSAKNSIDNELKFQDLFATNSSLSATNFSIKDQISNALITNYGTTYENLVSGMSVNGISYYPGFYFINSATADFNLSPVFAAGIEIPDEEDYIPAFFEGKAIMICEDEISKIKNPVIIIANGTDYVDYTSPEKDSVVVENNIPGKGVNTATIAEYRIDFRYDKTTYSEYSYEYRILCAGGQVLDGGYRQSIRNIHKNDIGKYFYTNFNVPLIGGGYWLVTFEYDWYTFKKPVGVPQMNGAPHGDSVKCRMTLADDWYQKIFFKFGQISTYYVWSKGMILIYTAN
jgi:hypothetical protein